MVNGLEIEVTGDFERGFNHRNSKDLSQNRNIAA
jgi:hypothetical protein